MRGRLFTRDEVNALIPQLELIMEQLQRLGLALHAHADAVARDGDRELGAVTTAELLERRPEAGAIVADMQRLLADIEARGGQFKGLELGLIDFPAVLDGERVLLCWQYGEKEVGFYHAPDVGFGGRKPLDRAVPRGHYLQ